MRLLLPALLLLAPASARAELWRLRADPAVERFAPWQATFERDAPPAGGNPFRDVALAGTVTRPDGSEVAVDGFCDAADGSVFRVRYLPLHEGKHTFAVAFNGGPPITGGFTAAPSKRPGPVRVDPKRPHHFVHEGTGEHFFWNGTTTYWLLGVQDEARMLGAVDRLAALGVNRIRLATNARTTGGERWFEPQVQNGSAFHFRINPWPAARPENPKDPGLDVTRFDVALWQKLDRLVRHADAKGVQVSIIFHLDGADAGGDPFGAGKKTWPGSDDEERYYRYAAARLSGFPNVMWDVTNEWHLFRNEAWVRRMAGVLRAADPAKHLMSVHGSGSFPFTKDAWADFALYQSWDEGGAYAFLRKRRAEADKLGRLFPHVNEEYGYEDHYPGPWGGGRKAPARSADNRRRLAWEMAMAGGYQTTGERADEPGQGGWLTGLGNEKMTMLAGYGHLKAFCVAANWWELDPVDGLADGGARVLADAARTRFVVYQPKGEAASLKVRAGGYGLRPFDCATGEWLTQSGAALTGDGELKLGAAPDGRDRAWVVTRD